MHKWMLTWNLQNLFSGLYLHAIVLFGSVRVVCSDCTPEQLAAIMNCSRHERHARNYDYMEGGDVRIRQLFSRTQWFLTIDDNGNINGTQNATNCHSKDNLFALVRHLAKMLTFKIGKEKSSERSMHNLTDCLSVRVAAARGGCRTRGSCVRAAKVTRAQMKQVWALARESRSKHTRGKVTIGALGRLLCNNWK